MRKSTLFVSQIVTQLHIDEYLVEERIRFVHSLGIPASQRKQLEDRYIMGVTSGYEHFSKLLEEWVRRKMSSATLGKLRDILRNCGFISALDSLKTFGDDNILIKIDNKSASHSKPISFGVTQPSSFFVGRDAEVKQLCEEFLDRGSSNKVVVISGMGGQGKTELCRQFIKTMRNKKRPPAMIWLSGDSATSLTSSIIQLAQFLDLPIKSYTGMPIPCNVLIAQIADKISADSAYGYVVVIDNVDETYSEFVQIQPPLVRRGGFVIVTTRKIGILSGEATQMKLRVLPEDDAHNLITMHLNRPPTPEEVHSLCKELGNHALALRQAVAYINAQQTENRITYGIQDYLQDFAKDKTLLHTQVNFIDGYDQTTFLIVNRAIITIQTEMGRVGRSATQLLDVLCLIRPDGISLACLQKFLAILEATRQWHHKLRRIYRDRPVELSESLRVLKKYSMIDFDDGETISIHRIVQNVVKSTRNSSACATKILQRIEIEKTSKEELVQVVSLWRNVDRELRKRRLSNLSLRIFNRMYELSSALTELTSVQFSKRLLDGIRFPISAPSERMSVRLRVGLPLSALPLGTRSEPERPRENDWIARLWS